jgi:hypothetical protein
MAELSFGSQNLRTRGSIFFDLIKGFWEPAEVRGGDIVVPALAGRIALNRVTDRRPILLRGYVRGNSAAAFNTNMTSLYTALDPTADDTLAVADGYLGTTGTWEIVARYLNSTISEIQQGPTIALITVELESVAPDWTPPA